MPGRKKAKSDVQRAISRNELMEMLERYRIGKKPLARLLGWGETTVLLYCSSENIPDNEYTRRLYFLFKHPNEYYRLLMERKEKLTDIAFRRSMQAVTAIIGDNKLLTAAQYVINTLEMDISLPRVEAILLVSQVASLVLKGKPIFEDDYQTERNNLPYRAVVEYMSEGSFCKKDIPEGMLSGEDVEILLYVSEVFDWYGSKAIQTLLAAERFRLCGKPDGRKRRVSKETMKKFYREIFEQVKIHSLKDISGYMEKRVKALKKNSG